MQNKKDLNVQIGLQVRAAREEARLTQERLAEKLDCSAQYVSDLERGVVGISVPTLKTLCTVLGISSDSILFGSDKERNYNAITEKCRSLSDEHYRLLLEIIDRYTAALTL